MMSLHLWHFDKQLFKDCSVLPRHHTLLINKSREQCFSKITRGDYKFRITIAIFSIPATIFVTRFLLTILIVVSRIYLSLFLYPDRERCIAMLLSLPRLLYCNIISLSRSRLLYRSFCITIVPIAVSRSFSRGRCITIPPSHDHNCCIYHDCNYCIEISLLNIWDPPKNVR